MRETTDSPLDHIRLPLKLIEEGPSVQEDNFDSQEIESTGKGGRSEVKADSEDSIESSSNGDVEEPENPEKEAQKNKEKHAYENYRVS